MNQDNSDKKSNSIQWYPGHMAKAKRNIQADISLVDVFIQVADARAPQSSQNQELWGLCGNKPKVLVLNKRDLAEAPLTKEWITVFSRQGLLPCAVNAAQKQGVKELIASIRTATEPLMQSLEAKGRLRRPVRCMIVGIPNCGKSTVINALSPHAMTKTGNKPGVTRGRQWIKTDSGLELMDTPGILWPKFASYETAFRLAAIGTISDGVFPIFQVAEDLVSFLRQKRPESLLERFKLKELREYPSEVLEDLGRSRGLLSQGNTVRMEDAAFLLLQEFRSGKLGKFSLESPADFQDTGLGILKRKEQK